jgi:hypothetical protein
MYAVVALVKLLQTLTGEGQVLRSVSRQDDLEVLPYLLIPEQTTLLVARCRSEGTSPLGALRAASLQSLRRSCPPELARWRSGPLARADGKRVWRRRASCLVDLRPFL